MNERVRKAKSFLRKGRFVTRCTGRIPTLKALAVATGLAVVLAACGGDSGDTDSDTGSDAAGPASFADMEPVKLKVATLYGPDNWQTKPLADYTDAVTKATEGKVEFEYFYGAALLAPAELADGLESGLADLAYFVPVYTPAKFPVDSWVSSLGFASSPSPIAGSLQGMAAVAEWGMNTAEYASEFEKAGIQPIVPRVQVIHKYSLLCKDAVTKLDQVKGKKIRIGGPAWAEEAKNLGATPVSLAGAEVYTGFQRGIFDCMMGGPEDMHGLKLTDIGKNFTNLGLTGFTSYAVGMSADKWESLPEAAQQVMWDEIPTYLTSFMASNFKQNCAFLETAEASGVTLHDPDPKLKEKVQEHHDNILAKATETAPDSVDDGGALVDSFVEGHERWLSKVEELGFPAKTSSWQELAESGSCEKAIDVDLTAWADAVQEEVFEPHRPGGE